MYYMYIFFFIHFIFSLYQSCAHVGATLFQLADLVATGITLLPDDPSCTEKLCQWTDPKG